MMDGVPIFGTVFAYVFGAGAALVFAAAGFTLGRVQRELHYRKSARANLARSNDRTKQRAAAVRNLVSIPDDDDDHGTGPDDDDSTPAVTFADSRGNLHVIDDDTPSRDSGRRAISRPYYRFSNPGGTGSRVLGSPDEASVAV